MKMIAGQFNDSFQPVMDGVANVTKNYAYWLNKKNVKCYVVTPDFPGYIDNESFEVLRYPSVSLPKRPPYRLGMPYFNFNFNRRINNIPFDIVHAHCPFSSGQLALQVAGRKDIPVIATFHSKYYDDFKEALKFEGVTQFFVKRVISFYNKVDFVWTVNKATVNTLRSYGYKGSAEVVYNGTDFTPPKDPEGSSELVNRMYNLKHGEPVFLFVGQHIWQKNLNMLVHALHHLKGMGLGFKMLFAGKGYAEDDLRDMVRDLKLEDAVRFIGTVTDRDHLKALFARADLFLFPSLYDTSGIVIQEAAAVSCPSLVINNSNVSEGITDGYNGFLCSDDPEAYARKIREIASNRERLVDTGRAAHDTLYRSWDRVIDEVGERYSDIVKTYRKINSMG